jgi:hypothetical protein
MGGTVGNIIEIKNTTAYAELLKAYKDLCRKVEKMNVTINGIPENSYIHTQNIASSSWTVNHNLGYKPGGILVMDSAGENWVGEVTHIDNNTLIINFNSSSFGGRAYIS